MNIQSMMKQAQKMQKDLQIKKSEIDKSEFEGSASLVKVVLNGKKEVLKVTINRDAEFNGDDLEMLEEMVMLAMNDAIKKIDMRIEKDMGAVSGGMSGLL